MKASIGGNRIVTKCPRCNDARVTTRVGLAVDASEAQKPIWEASHIQCMLLICDDFPTCRFVVAGAALEEGHFLAEHTLVPIALIEYHQQFSPEEQEYLKRHQYPKTDPGE